MSVRAWATAIVRGDTLADKLVPPPDERDEGDEGDEGDERDKGAADSVVGVRIAAPGRPASLAISRGRDVRVPPIAGFRDPTQRARILHALANHELQAIELFAWAVLAWPDAPGAFRRGLVAIATDEQRHLELYRARLAALGVAFGDHPVTGHFWNKLDHFATPLAFVCAMGLTFENANLDFAGDYAAAARACGDIATAVALEQVHADEIRHVHFAYVWLRRLAPDRAPWDSYVANVRAPLGPARARGASFDRSSRERAGLDARFLDALAACAPKRPSGEPR